MDRLSFIAQVRDWLGQARPEAALDTIATYLQTSSAAAEMQDAYLQVRARHARIRADQVKGILATEQIELQRNQLNDDILNLAELIVESETTPVVARRSGRPMRPLLVLGIIGGLVLAAILYIVFSGGENEVPPPVDPPPVIEPDPRSTPGDCPTFARNSIFNILVLPFQVLSGEPINAHISIQNRLALEGEKYRVPLSVKVRDIDISNSNDYPSNGGEAQAIGRPCRARLVIWGTTESGPAAGNIVTTRYKFLDLDDHFSLNSLQITEASELDTVRSLTSITTEGKLTENIERSIQLLLGIIAHESDQDSVAIAVLEKAEVDRQDSTATLIRNMLLADSYLKQGNTEKARQSYDSVLTVHPDYVLALNNRAALDYKAGNYEKAIEYYSRALAEQPANPTLKAQRAAAYIGAERLDKARQDINDLQSKQMVPDTNMLYWKKKLEGKEKQKKENIKKTDRVLRRRPNDVNALQDRAVAEFSLGDYRAAKNTADRLMQVNQKLETAYRIKAAAELEIGDTVAAQRVLDQAIRRRVIDARDIRLLKPVRPLEGNGS